MALVSLIATIIYVMDFIKRKKEREAAKIDRFSALYFQIV